MAHFARLGDYNKVIDVIVINNNVLMNNGIEDEQLGIDFCKTLFGDNTNWRQTSYNNSFRYNYASIGYTYDEINDAFIPPKEYESWILDTSNYKWKPPIDYPTDGLLYLWDEINIGWILNPKYN